MIVVLSRFRVANGFEEQVQSAFQRRPHLVDGAPGFLGLETFIDERDPSLFYLVTRWSDSASFHRWHESAAHHESHRFIPKGLKLDPAFTAIWYLKKISE